MTGKHTVPWPRLPTLHWMCFQLYLSYQLHDQQLLQVFRVKALHRRGSSWVTSLPYTPTPAAAAASDVEYLWCSTLWMVLDVPAIINHFVLNPLLPSCLPFLPSLCRSHPRQGETARSLLTLGFLSWANTHGLFKDTSIKSALHLRSAFPGPFLEHGCLTLGRLHGCIGTCRPVAAKTNSIDSSAAPTRAFNQHSFL